MKTGQYLTENGPGSATWNVKDAKENMNIPLNVKETEKGTETSFGNEKETKDWTDTGPMKMIENTENTKDTIREIMIGIGTTNMIGIPEEIMTETETTGGTGGLEMIPGRDQEKEERNETILRNEQNINLKKPRNLKKEKSPRK